MNTDRSITVVSKRPPLGKRLLAGGIAGADVGLFLSIGMSGYLSAEGLFLMTLFPAVLLAGGAGFVAYILQQRRSPFRRLNRDLTEINSLVERGLIDAEEYDRLKTRIVDDFQPQPVNTGSVVRTALWGALAGASVPLLLGGFTAAPFLAALASLLLPGLGGAAIVGGVTEIGYHLSQRNAPQLSAGEPDEWEALGSREPLMLDK